MNKTAVILLSGGLDSAVTLYIAKDMGFNCFCLIFDYRQRHKREIESAKKIAKAARCPWQILKINLPWKGSSLLNNKEKLPVTLDPLPVTIPSTYVPARNIIFLSFALSCAEAIAARAIFIGAHTEDYSGYPDCRKEFYRAFIKTVEEGTKTGVQGKPVKIITPLLNKSKAEIIKLGKRLKVPFRLTWSCYNGGELPCGKCDSCHFRAKGFAEAGMNDPIK